MVKRRTVFLSDAGSSDKLSRKHTTRKDFAKRLFHLLGEKEWNQSDLAREAGINRDSVSRYIRAQNLPDLVNLKKMADALGVEQNDLLPNFDMQAIEDSDDEVAFEIRALNDDPSQSLLRFNRILPTSVALKIAGMLEESSPMKKIG